MRYCVIFLLSVLVGGLIATPINLFVVPDLISDASTQLVLDVVVGMFAGCFTMAYAVDRWL